ncbi:efflux transporter outer membrane subunit [Acetobacter sp.]|uniref:efflux transporter outer membrane subunit n=1 Tax=Acetobacter sp. TaxID=440 RepID=UPI0039EBC313
MGAAKSKRVLIGLAVLLSGCAVGPNYKKPQSWTPPQWKMAQAGAGGSVTVPDAPDVNWWNIFQDPELTSLEKRLASQNLDVQKATAQLAESRAQLILAGAERFPMLSASGSYTRAQYSSQQLKRIVEHIGKSTGGSIGDLLQSSSSNTTIPLLDQWRDGVDATWELDLWGRVRRQYEAAQAYLDETAEERRSVLIAREADLARDYVTLRGTQQQLDILKQNRDDAQKMLDLSSARYQHGMVSELDQEEARSELETVQSQIPQLEQEVKLEINAISLLMGTPPGSLDGELAAPSSLQPLPPRVPVGIPSQLAERRPDIRAASAELHAATAEVGQAIADFYPRITIDAGFGMQSFSFRDLGMWNARAWNVGPTITIPIFQGGRLSGQLELKKANQKAAAIEYRKTVLSAWKDVDDALTAFTKDGQRKDELSARCVSDRRAYELALDRYRHGLDSFLRVLDSERRLFGSEGGLVSAVEQESVDVVRLYGALGGGWE